jgi:hypothetical protein
MTKTKQSSGVRQPLSFWKLTAISALISIAIYKLTGDTSVGELLFLTVLIFGTIKLISVFWFLGSVILKTIGLVLLVLAWAGIVFSAQ